MLTHFNGAERIAALQADGPTSDRLIVGSEIRFSEIIAALSVALDITQGNPHGHCMRTALIGTRLAESLQLSGPERSALFYALLLKDLGCSSNAAKMSYLFDADDRVVKHTGRMIDWARPTECIKHCWKHCASGGSVVDKLLRMAAMIRLGNEGARKIAEIRCERGAEIARMLHLPEATARAIYDLDEHWDGRGNPRGLKGQEISLLGRICCLAQTVEVFLTACGRQAAFDVANERRGKWFDPQLVDALSRLKRDDHFWRRVTEADPLVELGRQEPEDGAQLANEDCLDRVAEAFARVVDAKSPWTYQHSTRVAEIAVGMAEQFDCPAALKRDLRRAALLHDIGKLGVSNLVLDKADKPTAEEVKQIRRHPDYTQQILEQVDAFKPLADVAAAHHERLDGSGYHRRLDGSRLPWATRVLTVADIYEAMSAKRPYRDAVPWPRIQEILRADVGQGVDRDCVEALERWQDRRQLESRVELQMQELDRLLAEF